MIVNEFRWLTVSDDYLSDFDNWSRPYEYAWVLNNLKKNLLNNPHIHNTCCGTQPIHLQFSKKLNLLSDNVLHTDAVYSDLFNENVNFKLYNLEEKINLFFDVVICVSTLEELPKSSREKVFHNLYDQLKPGGRLLLTCDYPHVDLEFLEKKLKTSISTTNSDKLNSLNSIVKNEEFKELNIIVVDISKEV